MSQNPQNPKKFNLAKWISIVSAFAAIAGVIATLVTVPEFRCFLLRLSCPLEQVIPTEVELFTQTESGEFLGGVQITVIGSGGPPETTQTDNNGYAKVRIANKGEVKVNLSKSGYPVQNFTINLQNEQGTVRTIRFRPSGEPEVIASSTAPPPPPSPMKPFTPQPQIITALENDFMSIKLTGISKDQYESVKLAFVITNKTNENLYLGLSSNYGTITDNFGQVCGGQQLVGLALVGSSANTPDSFTLISPNSTLTVGSSGCTFSPNSTEFNASFPLVRYQANTTKPAGEQTGLTAGFTGLKLP
ncbi:MAG: hypothetical protein ACKN9A_19585 [Microcystis aeruginosa]